jgi:DNA-binding NtrC family response regulator
VISCMIFFRTVLLDLKMPEVNGIEVAAVISAKKPAVPIIIMTAFPSLDSAIESIKYGVFEYLVKPFKMADLFGIVQKAIEEYDARTSSKYASAKSAQKY